MFVDQDMQPVDPMADYPDRKCRPPYARTAYLTLNDGESMTQQADLDQTDVNAIVARFERTGMLPQDNIQLAQYGDVTELQGTFAEVLARAQDKIKKAQEFADSWKPPAEPVTPTPPADPPPEPQPA